MGIVLSGVGVGVVSVVTLSATMINDGTPLSSVGACAYLKRVVRMYRQGRGANQNNGTFFYFME